MAVTALPARTGRHAKGSGRVATIRRVEAPAAAPPTALTITLNIPLTGDTLPPQAHRLIEAVRELVEAGQGSVAMDQPQPAAEPATPAREWADGTVEVRLLTASRQVHVDGELLPLTRLEFDLLLFLADHPRRVFSRTQLLTAVWGYEHTGERTVDVHVRRLRVKMGAQLPLITTVYGVGYRLADEARIVVLPHD
ncbi:winged helix-turn-helix domain-containing protein [Actinoplanes friuliensis]|jgi:two-component system, OmpR family, response regulator|uniref:YclJ-like transcriptional regulatory protein n=1 Tax=Actinoplanes friuliensis DSM 7358 TaxID=1246995 RepID=U5W337_9ACTN|nr:winged helix-turn-helix domain-containing protein [Actinoplanes friuliensis]AGZ43613.1 yclJ-like transcriptional regulatory protein [Actinoplanes friuliensis DSM 7358]